uniref:Uncharacterized protein n=1 Tax=Cacopsylla melanoneura TaxID=428564 RepID=A0A8D8WTL8_9HEMI
MLCPWPESCVLLITFYISNLLGLGLDFWVTTCILRFFYFFLVSVTHGLNIGTKLIYNDKNNDLVFRGWEHYWTIIDISIRTNLIKIDIGRYVPTNIRGTRGRTDYLDYLLV